MANSPFSPRKDAATGINGTLRKVACLLQRIGLQAVMVT